MKTRKLSLITTAAAMLFAVSVQAQQATEPAKSGSAGEKPVPETPTPDAPAKPPEDKPDAPSSTPKPAPARPGSPGEKPVPPTAPMN